MDKPDYKQWNENFLKQFDFKKLNFYEPVLFDNAYGLSVKKKLHSDCKDNTSMIRFYLSDDDTSISPNKKLIVDTTYGRQTPGGVAHIDYDFSDPINLTFSDEFHYNQSNGRFYKNFKEISADGILKYVYDMHIKPTKFLQGLGLRLRMRFWRQFLRKIVESATYFFYCCLLLISGDKYEFNPIVKEETVSKFGFGSQKNELIPTDIEKTKEIDFFGFKVARWPIGFYSALHLTFYIVFSVIDYYPALLSRLIQNTFLTIMYIALSFGMIDIVLPSGLKHLIRYLAKLSFNLSVKSINI